VQGPIVPQHVQIVPIEHVPNTVSLSAAAAAEFCRYTGALKKCFDEKLSMDLLLFGALLPRSRVRQSSQQLGLCALNGGAGGTRGGSNPISLYRWLRSTNLVPELR
jgi:hypothetical protein